MRDRRKESITICTSTVECITTKSGVLGGADTLNAQHVFNLNLGERWSITLPLTHCEMQNAKHYSCDEVFTVPLL